MIGVPLGITIGEQLVGESLTGCSPKKFKEVTMHSELCPVCHGTGKYNGAQCHGCDGDGWVEVHNDPEYIPYDYGYPNITAAPFVYPYSSFYLY